MDNTFIDPDDIYDQYEDLDQTNPKKKKGPDYTIDKGPSKLFLDWSLD